MAEHLSHSTCSWLEIDNQDPDALLQLKMAQRTPICTGEQLLGLRQYQPYFRKHAMDTVKVDVQWQGFSQAKKVADLAEVYELNIGAAQLQLATVQLPEPEPDGRGL